MSADKSEHTPLMQQYHDIKVNYPDALLFFQVGDFYELFFEDAKRASAFLGIALTARGKNKDEPIPLCGVPIHAKDQYVSRLVRGGFHVALCDQLEAPTPGTLVKRGVVQVFTPGTLTDTPLLDEKSASYLFSFFPMENSYGLLFGELLTAQLFATVVQADHIKHVESEMARFFPDEIIVPDNKLGKSFLPGFKRAGYRTSLVNESMYKESLQYADCWVKAQFKKPVLDVLQKNESLELALHYFYAYMRRNQQVALDQFRALHIYQPEDFLMLDVATQRNLELVKNNQGSAKNTLFSVMDSAVTPMGSRMIKKWLLRPLIKQKAIVQRQEVVGLLVNSVPIAQRLINFLVHIGDVERVVGRIALMRASVHDYITLKNALAVVPSIRILLQEQSHILLFSVMYQNIGDFTDLYQLLACSLYDDDGDQGFIIKTGFDTSLDYLRELVSNSNEKILAMEKEQQQVTGISSLKIRYTQQQGYYIEITKANVHLVPDNYVRQQSLVGKERFMTPELRELHHDIMRARTEIEQVETAAFMRIKNEVSKHTAQLRKLAYALAQADGLCGFAQVASANNYVRPTFNDKQDIVIVEGRHPVIEQTSDAVFIANDTELTDEQSLWIITGPNMGGKSTYLRQVALTTILAQCGSFVPAKSANLPILDRVFTRIGAGDNLAEGKSTFLVEMEETATICTQATCRSLVILDEVGRGTSTFDGLAIAQAVVEHIYTTIGARCLFATHYHELTQLDAAFSGIVPYHAASKKTDAGIIFLYKMIRGVADGSFGIEVAKLAQLPNSLIERSQVLLSSLTDAQARLKTHESVSIDCTKEAQNKEGFLLGVESVTRAANSHDGDTQTVHVLDGARLDQKDSASISKKEIARLRQQESLHNQEMARLRSKLARSSYMVDMLEALDYDNLSPKQAFDLLWQLRQKE